jgi:serine/threonine protein kinase HipA of HipAB toxin-antitoxin module
MAHLALLATRVAAESPRRFVLLDARPYRLEGGGVGRGFMFAAALETDRGGRKDGGARKTRMMNALESLARNILAATITVFCHLAHTVASHIRDYPMKRR